MILFIVGIGGIAFLIDFITNRGVNVKAKGIEIGKDITGKALSIEIPKKDNVHANCPRWHDILLVIEWSTLATRKISHLEEIQLIKDQMNFAEEQLSDLRDIFRRKFLKLLASVKSNKIGILHTHEACDYENILRIVTFELTNEFRFIFRENHLLDKSELEFEAYLKNKKDHINHKITELLNDIYPPAIQPSREEVYDSNIENMSECNNIIEVIIRHGRYIASEYEKKKDSILNELNTKVEKVIGSNGDEE
jgi:hypothetical protein